MECSGRVRMCPWNVSSKKRLCSVSVPRGWLFLEGVVTLWYLPHIVGLDFTPDLPCRETKPTQSFRTYSSRNTDGHDKLWFHFRWKQLNYIRIFTMTCDQLDYQSLFVRHHVISCLEQSLHKTKTWPYNVCFTDLRLVFIQCRNMFESIQE